MPGITFITACRLSTGRRRRDALPRPLGEEAHEVQLIRRLRHLHDQLRDAMAAVGAADDGARLLRESACDAHAHQALHVRLCEIAHGRERPVPHLRAGGDDLERRMHDLDLDVHVVDLVLQNGFDEESVLPEGVDADRLGAVEDCGNLAHDLTICAGLRR
jgi:hypothetical protein